jgi:hypothetical protein
MSQAQSFYEEHSFYGGLTWEFVREQIGQGLRERYEVSKDLPPKFLRLLRKLDASEGRRRLRTPFSKLDAIEGNYLLRYATPVEPRNTGQSDCDWPLCT